MEQKFELIKPTSIFKPQPYGGVRSANDMSDFMDGAITDIYTLVDMVNTKLIPILNGLPLAEYSDDLNAIIDGLTAAACYIDHLVTTESNHADYYLNSVNLPNRPNTIKEVFDLLITNFKALQSTVSALSDSIANEEEPLDTSAIVAEIKDLRSSVRDIITVLRSLKFYTDWERIHALTVLADPDELMAPIQTLVKYGPAVKFSGNSRNNLYVNFTIPRHIDPAQPIILNFVYCMGGDPAIPGDDKLKLDFDYQILADGDDLYQKTPVSRTMTISTPNAWIRGSYTGTDFVIVPNQVLDLVNLKFSRDVTVANNNTNDLYILDISIFGKRLEQPQVFI